MKRDTMAVLVNIGFGNMVSSSRVIAIVTPGSAPMKRLRDEAKKRGKACGCNRGQENPLHNCDGQRPCDTVGPAAGNHNAEIFW